jgi:hypothetical protein
MFRGKQRPKGLEFGCCETCNMRTRNADLAASFVSRVTITPSGTNEFNEVKGLYALIKGRIPELYSQFSRSQTKIIKAAIPGPYVGFTELVEINLGTPVISRHLTAFAAKLGMALYAEHTGEALPEGGAVTSYWMSTYGVNRERIIETLEMLPMYETLKQGKNVANDQFQYRFNTDEKTIVAALSDFHNSLYILTIASAVPEYHNVPKGHPTQAKTPLGGIAHSLGHTA